MNAVVVTSQSGPDGLEFKDVADITAKPGERLIQVEAVGLNFADLLGAKGKYPGGPQPPYICGREFAGTDRETGKRVMGYMQSGACAQLVSADPNLIWPAPSNWTAAEAAAFPVNYFTAWMCYWRAGLIPSKSANLPADNNPKPVRALVHGAAGGVGTAAVLLARLFGYESYGTSSSDDKLARMKAYGLTHGINYKSEDYEQRVKELTGGEGVDIVFDSSAGEHTAKSLRCCRRYGRVMMYGNNSGERPRLDTMAMYDRTLSLHGIWLSRLSKDPALTKQALASMMPWIESGELKPIGGATLPLSQAADGFRLLDEGKNFGKVVLTVG